jgi:hypothetical protein
MLTIAEKSHPWAAFNSYIGRVDQAAISRVGFAYVDEPTSPGPQLAGQVDQMVLFTGDGSFCPLIAALQRRGVRVTIVSSLATQPPMVASELRRQADAFVDLRDLSGRVSAQ